MHSTTSDSNKLNDPKIISAWAFYDWANSAFALVITTAIFPAYYLAVTNDMIHIAGLIVPNSALYAFTITIAYIILTLASPLLSGMADYGGRKKQFLLFFTLIGSISCIGLFFFQGMNQIFLGTLLFLLGLIGFAGGLVFYNAFLPEIASPDQYDRVSAKGFSLGFLGSLILLSFCLLMIQKPGIIGVEEGTTLPVRLSFVLVGIWWLFFSLRSLAMLPGQSNHKPYDNPFKNGINAFLKVWKSSKQFPELYKFLFSFFTYSAGVQTILYMAATFAEKELHFETSELILVILFIQLLGILGAYIASRCSIKWGNKITLMFILFIWTIVCIVAYMTYVKSHFYFLAASVGFVMGAVQSLSRSTYAKLIPKQTADNTSYFSLYDILEKAAIILGTFIFGFLNHLTGSMRFSILFLSAIFILSIFLFSRIKMKNEA
jgi:UMF1 family MFS transporter